MGSRARGGGSAGWKPTPEVKVKHIIPRKVSTDEASFKDVVQRLTGKDSAAARVELLGARDGSSVVAPTTMAPVLAGGGSGRSDVGMEGGGGGAGFNMGTAVSFHDAVLPSLEEMDCWWGFSDIDSYAVRP